MSLVIGRTWRNSNVFNQQLDFKLGAADVGSSYRLIDSPQLTQLEPELVAEFDQGTFLADEAWISTSDAMAALSDQIIRDGGQWFPNCPVDRVVNARLVAGGSSP